MNTAGPLLHATLIVSDMPSVVAAYSALGLTVIRRGVVDMPQAQRWGQSSLSNAAWLELAAAPDAPPLLRLIEVPGTPPRPTRFSHGWMALEILVRDVDALAQRLPIAGFEVVGPPADLDVSPHIRAMQVVGPVGEMLYLTQVRAPVPPFQLPMSAALTHDIGPLFIGVLSTPSRAATLQACAALQPTACLSFDTKITVLNRAWGQALDARWPVATAQLAGDCLLEIDEVAAAGSAPTCAAGDLPAGLAWLTTSGDAISGGRLFELSSGAWLEVVASA
jgi:hypothetical protein